MIELMLTGICEGCSKADIDIKENFHTCCEDVLRMQRSFEVVCSHYSACMRVYNKCMEEMKGDNNGN